MRLVFVLSLLTHVLCICEADGTAVPAKYIKNEQKKIKIKVKTEKYSPLNIWNSSPNQRKRRRNLIVKCCGASKSCLNVAKIPGNETLSRTSSPRKDGQNGGDAKLKPASGSPGSGGNVPVDNNPANSNPKNKGGSAGGGDGSGSPPLGGGPSKTDGGSSSDNGAAGTGGSGVAPGGAGAKTGGGAAAVTKPPGGDEGEEPGDDDPPDKSGSGGTGGAPGENSAPGQTTGKASGGNLAGGGAVPGGATTVAGQVTGRGNSTLVEGSAGNTTNNAGGGAGAGSNAPSPSSNNTSSGGSAPASGSNNTAGGNGGAASPGSNNTVSGAGEAPSGSNNTSGGGGSSSSGSATGAGGAPSPGSNSTSGGGAVAPPASGTNGTNSTGAPAGGDSSSGSGGSDPNSNGTKTGDSSAGGAGGSSSGSGDDGGAGGSSSGSGGDGGAGGGAPGSGGSPVAAPPKAEPPSFYKGIVPHATTDSPYQIPSDSGPEPTNAPDGKPLYESTRKCEKDKSLFDGDGTLINQTSYGLWVQLCNESLLFGSNLANWTKNHDSCCALGMKPLYILGRKDNWCLQKYIYDSWTLNRNYWSGGIKDNDTSAAYAPFNNAAPTPALNWAPNLNEEFHCLRMKIDRDDSPTPNKMFWSFKNCSKLQLMACKRSLFKEKDGSLSDPSRYGNWFRAFNHTFLFGTKQNWTNSHKTCGRLGMKLVSYNLPVIEKWIRHLSNKESFSNKSYWTSGYDRYNPGKYNWCSANNSAVEGINWKNGVAGKTAGCLKVFYHIMPKAPALTLPVPIAPKLFRKKRAPWFGLLAPATTKPPITTPKTTEGPKDLNGTFQVGDCAEKNNFICMAPVMKTPMQKQKDCMAAFKITQNDIDTILSMETYTKEMRCFMRCMGDDLDLVFENLPVDVEILKLLEENGGSNEPKLDKHFDIYDTCGKERGTLDECETTAKVFKCGVEKDAQGMADLIVGSAVKAEEDANAGNVVGSLNTTCRAVPCTSDPVFVAKRAAWKTYPNGAGNFFMEACGKVYFVGGYFMPKGMYEAHAYCCKYGMQLARFETRDEANCFAEKMQASPYGYKIFDGGVRLFGTNEDNPDFPVWCPDKTPIDVTLFGGYSNSANLAAGLYIYVWTVVYKPVFVQVDLTTAYDFACEDP